MPTQAQDASDAEAPELSDLVGSVLAERYRIDEMLGEGGMGVVFRAHHLMLKRDVAIKLLHLELSSNPQLSARFDREAQSAARLEHPNIVHVSEFGSTDDGMKYMVMQLLEGCELEQLVGHGIPVDPERAVSLAVQIFRGLDHAHKHGVVHRDLKPENVFVTQDHEARETLKIVDFGIAKIVASEDEQDAGTTKPLTRHGLVFGTPEYMSPEQATGVEVDARTDLYSAGVILYEMLAGHRPFDSEDKIALIRMQVASEAPAFERDLPEPLANLVFELLSKEREGRPDTAAQVLHRLEAMQHTDAAIGSSAVMRAHTRPPRDEGTTAVALPRGANPLPSAGPSAWERWRRPLVAAVVTGTVFALVATWLDKSDEQADAAIAASGEPEGLDAAAAASTLNEASFAVIDRELLAKHGDAALELVKPLKDQNPNDPQLLWREGQALALAKANKDSLALAAYAEALEKDPKLLDDAHFYAELYDLLRKRKLRDQALDFALQRLGENGHKFLLELVNERNPSRALNFADRHRALSALSGHPASGPLIDRRINLARDLWQSSRGRSPMPCRDFRQALADIGAVGNVYFEPGVGRAKVPKPGKDEGELACEGAQAELERLREALAKLKAESAESGESGESGEGSEN